MSRRVTWLARDDAFVGQTAPSEAEGKLFPRAGHLILGCPGNLTLRVGAWTVKCNKVDLLRRTPEELELRRGYYAVHEASHPHWKYFLFD
jgi:hypothetical protein